MAQDAILFEIEPVCDAFDAAWIDGGVPEIAAFLEEAAEGGDQRDEGRSRVLFEELLAIDVEYRKQRGLPNDTSFYAPHFPAYLEIIAKKVPRGPASGRLSDYVILDEIGRGGMGVVHRARQISLNRIVALKRLPAHAGSSPEAVQRFQRESQAAAGLNHRGIVPIFEAGEDDGVFFFAMMLIEGESLDRIRRRLTDGSAVSAAHTKALSSSDTSNSWAIAPQFETLADRDPDAFHHAIARVGLQVADALAHAHERGVIHRDIKPSNLLLDRRGVVWVADFGLAQVENSDLTASGDFVGTLRYMSPERLNGRGDERGDLYGLGATLYELMTRHTLFDAAEPGRLIEQVRDREPTRPRAIDARIPRDLETIVQKALSKEPGQRYPSAAAMSDDLRRFLEGRTILARRTSAPETLVRWARRHRALASALAAITVLLIAAVITSTIAAARFKNQGEEKARLAESEGALRRVAEEKQTELTRTLYVAQMNLAGATAQSSGGTESLRRMLDPWQNPAPDTLDPRGWEWWFLHEVAHGHAERIDAGQLLFDVDGHPSRPLVAISGAQVLVWNTATRAIEHEFSPGGMVRSVRWSPGGDRLAAIDTTGVHVWSARDWTEIAHFGIETPTSGSLAWSPAGDRLAVQTSDRRSLQLLRVATGSVLAETTQRLGTDGVAFSFSPDGALLAAGAEDGEVLLLDGHTLEMVRALSGHTPPIQQTAFHPDGRLATSGVDPVIRIWDPRDGRLLMSLPGHDQRVTSVSWNEDGRLASASWDHTVRLWNVDAGMEILRLRGHTHYVSGVDWSPDGEAIIATSWDRSALIWPTRRGAIQVYPELRTTSPMANSRISWMPGGGPLLASNGMDTMSLSRDNDARTMKRLERLALASTISSDGKYVATVTDVPGTDAIEVRSWPGMELVFSTPFEIANSPMHIAWHPSEPTLGVRTSQGLLCVSAKTHSSRKVIDSAEKASGCLTWSPDGARILVGDGSQVKLLSWPDGDTLLVRDDFNQITDAAFSPDGRRFAIAANEASCRILDAETLDEVMILEGHTLGLDSVAWQGGGARIATSSQDKTVRIWDAATSEMLLVLGTEHAILDLEWSPDQQQLAGITSRGIVHVWDAGERFTAR